MSNNFPLKSQLIEKSMQVLEDYYMCVQDVEKYYERDFKAALKI